MWLWYCFDLGLVIIQGGWNKKKVGLGSYEFIELQLNGRVNSAKAWD